MKLRAQILPWAAGGLAAASFILALLHLVALVGGGEVQVAGNRLAVVGAGYDQKAEELLAMRNPPLDNLALSEKLSRLAIAEFPYDTSAWLRIAYIDQFRNSGLSRVGVDALSRSYDLVAVDPLLAAWRVHFALENWRNLPNTLRKSVETEARALSSEGRGRAKLQAALEAVGNPEVAPLVQMWMSRYVINASRTEQAARENSATDNALLKN